MSLNFGTVEIYPKTMVGSTFATAVDVFQLKKGRTITCITCGAICTSYNSLKFDTLDLAVTIKERHCDNNSGIGVCMGEDMVLEKLSLYCS